MQIWQALMAFGLARKIGEDAGTPEVKSDPGSEKAEAIAETLEDPSNWALLVDIWPLLGHLESKLFTDVVEYVGGTIVEAIYFFEGFAELSFRGRFSEFWKYLGLSIPAVYRLVIATKDASRKKNQALA